MKAKDPDESAAIAGVLAGMKGLRTDHRQASRTPTTAPRQADKVLSTAGAIGLVIAGMGVVLAIAAVLLIGNTIRLSIFARRREVEVMKLVGATNWFVRWPFMLEGMICGVVGAVGAVVVMFISCEAAARRLRDADVAWTSRAGSVGCAARSGTVAILLMIAATRARRRRLGPDASRKFLRVWTVGARSAARSSGAAGSSSASRT